MAKLLKFPDRKRELGVEDAQRRWLEQNPQVWVVTAWEWPTGTWFQLRRDKVRVERKCG